MFPKRFLSPHFWSIQQRFQFTTEFLQDRLQYQLSVLRFLQSRLSQLRSNDTAYLQMRNVLGRLGAGQHATVDEVLALTPTLSAAPYNLESLPQNVLVCGTIKFCTRDIVYISDTFYIRNSLICAVFMASIADFGSDHDWPTMRTSCTTWIWRYGAREAFIICRWMRWCVPVTFAV